MINYHSLRNRVDAYETAVLRRVRAECSKAGIDPNYIGTALHNAMIAYREGKAWRGVDYRHARKAVWLLKRRDAAGKLLNRLYERKGAAAFDWS